jgi:hypothetical protein
MFKSLRYSYRHKEYMLVDSEFEATTKYGNATLAIMDVYPKDKVLANLKVHFSQFYPIHRRKMLETDSAWCNHNFNFTKYYPCIRRHIEKLEFVGK